jgi:hypothetical protein
MSKITNMHCVTWYSMKHILNWVIQIFYASFQWRRGLSTNGKLQTVLISLRTLLIYDSGTEIFHALENKFSQLL